ncbi:hypothetical protein AB0M34_25765 [Nocardia sp. NPDC050193]
MRIYRLLDELLADLPAAERGERVHQMSRTVTANLADLEERLENGNIDAFGARRAIDVLISGSGRRAIVAAGWPQRSWAVARRIRPRPRRTTSAQ